jgi:endonuclease/exonuclease/phosphatase family metal-dependent hydrolase
MLRRRAFLVVAALALAGAVCPGQQPTGATPAPVPPGHAAPAAPSTFRVMTYNIHHGEGVDGRLDIERVAALIRDERADLVALQEVDKGVERTSRRDLPAELASLTGMTCLFRNNHAFQGGEYGNAILSRFPVKRWTNTLLRMLRPGEQRGVLQAVVDVGGRDLLFLATHIDYRPDDAERVANVEQFREVLAEYGNMPALFGGDFNDTPGSRAYAAMAELFDDVWVKAGDGVGFTIPSREPNKRIDFLWLRHGASLRPIRAWVPRSEASDHLPVVAEFAWTATPAASGRAGAGGR